MARPRLPPSALVIFLAIAMFLTFIVIVMLGPLLVDLAKEFRTSVAVTGQLTAATSFTWALTALVAGALSDTYGRRLITLLSLILMAAFTLPLVLLAVM